MISYGIYKLIHFICLGSWMLLIGYASACSSYKKKVTILMGIISFLTFTAGMGLMARLGISHTGPYPSWVITKVICWLILAFSTHFVIKRFESLKNLLCLWSVLLFGIAAFAAINKF